MNKRVVAVLAIAVLFPLLLAAESFWEGSAAMGLYGRFPTTGFYGASNSFSPNTMIQVENLENGRKVNVIITGRTGGGSLFLILSQSAAEALGVASDEVIRARVVLATDEMATAGIWPDDQPYHPDPDVNPFETAETLPTVAEAAESAILTEREPIAEPIDTPAEEIATEDARETEKDAGPGTVEETVSDGAAAADAAGVDRVDVAAAEPDSARINGLDRVSPGDETQPDREGIETPQISPPDVPVVSSLLPPPEFDVSLDESSLVARNEPDIPKEAVVVDAPIDGVPAPDSAYVSSLLPSPRTENPEAVPLAVIPPEPVYVAEELPEEAPPAQDILTVSDLLPQPELDDSSTLVLSRSVDSPAPRTADEEAVADRGQGPWLTELKTANVPSGREVEQRLSVADIGAPPIPTLEEDAIAEIEPAEDTPDTVSVSALRPFSPMEEGPLSVASLPLPQYSEDLYTPVAEDILRVTDLKEQPRVVEATEVDVVAALPAIPPERTARVATEAPSEPIVQVAQTDADAERISEPPPETDGVGQVKTPTVPGEEAVVVVAAVPDIDAPETAATTIGSPAAARQGEGSSLEALRSARRPVAVGVFADYTVTTELKSDAYYLQLGAFREPNTAGNVAVGLSDTYPVTVYASGMDDSLRYKVMLGPLKRDESGALLREFRAKGFSDAFVRKGS